MTKPLDSADFSVQLALEPATISESGQVIRERCLLAHVEIGLELDQRFGPSEKKVQVGGISDVTERANLISSTQILRPPSSGCLHDDRNEPGNRIGPNSLGQLISVHPWHHDVSYNEIRLVRLDRRKGLVAVCCRGYVISCKGQCGLDQAQFIGVIVNDENVG